MKILRLPATRTLLLALLLSSTAAACSKKLTEAEMKANLKRQADSMGQAVLKHDFAAVVSCMYDDAVNAMGGRERLVRMMHQSDAEMTAKGFPLHNVTMGEPASLVESHGQHFAIVPESLDMSAPGGRLRASGFLLAISNDAGFTWKFLDGAGLAQPGQNLQTLLPNLPASFKLPPRQDPVFVPAG